MRRPEEAPPAPPLPEATLDDSRHAANSGGHSERARKIRLVFVTEERVTKRDLRAMCDPCSDVEFALALHEAREAAREDFGLEFVPVKGEPDVLARATDQQKLRRGLRFRSLSLVKLKRAGRVLATTDPAALDDDGRQRLQMAQDKTAMMVAQTERLTRMRKPLPMGDSKQPAFPGRPKR